LDERRHLARPRTTVADLHAFRRDEQPVHSRRVYGKIVSGPPEIILEQLKRVARDGRPIESRPAQRVESAGARLRELHVVRAAAVGPDRRPRVHASRGATWREGAETKKPGHEGLDVHYVARAELSRYQTLPKLNAKIKLRRAIARTRARRSAAIVSRAARATCPSVARARASRDRRKRAARMATP